MRVDRFSYDLPPALIAQEALPDREASRLMIVKDEGILDARIGDLTDHVAPGSLIVTNDTRVIRARILGTKEGSGGKAEIFLVRKLADEQEGDRAVQRWHAMGRASKGLRPGTRVLKGSLVAEVAQKAESGLFEVLLRSRDSTSIDDAVEAAGQIPLPPYIKREPLPEDEERYQTVFAKTPGAVAAPTAGLHLTRPLLGRLEAKGCEIASCTLHVGLGTFQPVTVDDLDDHPMHAEYYEIPRSLSIAIARARERGAPVIAVGTTVVRALESARDPDRLGLVRPSAGETRLLVQPGYAFGVVDRLLTNFHLPNSTLLALVCAFSGIDRVLDAYRRAVKSKYRFFSYGDAMLLDRDPSASESA